MMDFGTALFAIIVIIVGLLGIGYFVSIGLIFIIKKLLFINYEVEQ